MFQLRTAFATLALIVGLGAASHAQMPNLGLGGGFGQTGLGGGGFGQTGLGGTGFGVSQPGFVGQPVGVIASGYPVYGPGYPYYFDNSYIFNNNYSGPLYPAYGPWLTEPQTTNSMGSLMNSFQRATSHRGSWR